MINFKIVTYRTGWNFEISTYSGGTRVGAHPDSLLVLESLNDGKVTICLGIEQDGLPNATCQCSFGSQTLNCLMNEQVNLTLSKGQQITLTSLAASKARCWYYWDLIGITILANQANQYYSNHRAHLGDAIAMMIGLENYAICNGIDKISLVHQPVFEAIADAFYFEKVRLTTPKEDCQDITPALHKASYQEPWIKRFTNALCNMYGGRRPAKVSIPRVRERKSLVSEDIVLCQFDTPHPQAQLWLGSDGVERPPPLHRHRVGPRPDFMPLRGLGRLNPTRRRRDGDEANKSSEPGSESRILIVRASDSAFALRQRSVKHTPAAWNPLAQLYGSDSQKLSKRQLFVIARFYGVSPLP